MSPRVAFRDISRATDTRTVRAALIPGNVVANNSGPYLLFPEGDQRDEAFVLGVVFSSPFDWFARTIVESHLSFFVLNALPIPDFQGKSRARARIVEVAGRLAAPDSRFQSWAAAVGVEVGTVGLQDVDDLLAELDALVAFGFGLSPKELTHLYETLHRGWDHEERLAAVLAHFSQIETDR